MADEEITKRLKAAVGLYEKDRRPGLKPGKSSLLAH